MSIMQIKMTSNEAERIVEFFGPSNSNWNMQIYSSVDDSDNEHTYDNVLEFGVSSFAKESFVELLKELFPKSTITLVHGRDWYFVRFKVDNHKQLFEEIGLLYSKRYPPNANHGDFEHHCYNPAFGFHTQ